jgi:hypothetical protein
VVSTTAGAAIFDVSADMVDVESLAASELEEPPPQEAKNAQTVRAIRTFFILTNLNFKE